QGHDFIPNQIAIKFEEVFDEYLPDWSVNGKYNYSAAPSTQKAAVQMGRVMQSGSHSWYNTALELLLNDIDDGLDGLDNAAKDLAKTERLAALVNYLDEANNPANIDPGGRTGGYVGFLSKRDPRLIKEFGLFPDTDWMNKYHTDNLTWEKIENSPAGKEVIQNLKPRVVDGKLVYDGKLSGTGVFSEISDKFDTVEEMSASKFSSKWVNDPDNNIRMHLDGSVTGKDGAIKFDSEFANNYLDQQIGGRKISSRDWIPKSFIKFLKQHAEKIGILAAVAIFLPVALSATEAQASEEYDSEKANDANRNFIVELVGEGISELAGIVVGAIAGIASFGLAAIPTAFAVAEAGLQFGKYLGGLFYDNFTDMANAMAESLAPIFSSIAETAIDLAAVLYNVISDVADVMTDYVFGVDGLFGLEGPLFGDDGPLQFASKWLGDHELLSNSGEWNYESFGELLEGTDADDVLIHDGWGEARGGKGDDILIGWRPEYKAKGDPLFEEEGSPL
ncbi:MAG: hypothetical protein GY761_04075, partial [Hyphomicrobiales bacterium]|nr:hypothetical protein [Hyphomicrobiales bacterium]